MRILIAEDDEVMRGYLVRSLERAGYDVTEASGGQVALELIERGPPFDLLLSDIVMPELDGIALAQKASAVAPDMRVIFITGFSAVSLRAGKTLPQAKLLSKPFHLRDLVTEIERAFSSASA